MTDPIADMLARIRNAVSAKHSRVDIPASKLKQEIARILKEQMKQWINESIIMSRIGKKPITIPKGVTVNINDGELEVKGTKGVLRTPIPEGITFKVEGEILSAERASKDQAALHGLARAL